MDLEQLVSAAALGALVWLNVAVAVTVFYAALSDFSMVAVRELVGGVALLAVIYPVYSSEKPVDAAVEWMYRERIPVAAGMVLATAAVSSGFLDLPTAIEGWMGFVSHSVRSLFLRSEVLVRDVYGQAVAFAAFTYAEFYMEALLGFAVFSSVEDGLSEVGKWIRNRF